MMISRIQPVREIRVRENGVPERAAAALAHPGPVRASEGMSVGRVSEAAADGAWRIVAEPHDLVTARVAVSCLVRPQPGDLVQVYRTAFGCWVLAILERRDGERDVTLDFGSASVLLEAHDLRLRASDQLNLEAAHLASRATVVTQAAQQRHANVTGTDATHAGNAFIHTERHLGLHAKSAAVKSASLLKIDAGQIHMG